MFAGGRGGEVLHVRIRQTRENRKDEQVPYKLVGGVLHRCVHERLYLRLGEVAPIHAFGRVDISGKGIERQTPVVPCNGNDVFQHNHVAPHGIGAAFLLRAQKILEVVDEREVEFLLTEYPHACRYGAKTPGYGCRPPLCRGGVTPPSRLRAPLFPNSRRCAPRTVSAMFPA